MEGMDAGMRLWICAVAVSAAILGAGFVLGYRVGYLDGADSMADGGLETENKPLSTDPFDECPSLA